MAAYLILRPRYPPCNRCAWISWITAGRST